MSDSSGLLETLVALPKLGWYYGNIAVEQAELLLKSEPNGSFLVRDSSDSKDPRDIFTVTFKMLNCFGSVRIDYAKGFFSLSLQDPGLPMFRTLMDLIAYCLYRSVKLRQPVCILTGHSQHNNVSLYLTRPVSRHTKMHSLMYYCREAVSELVTRDKLDKLGLPVRLVDHFVSKNPHFDEQLYHEWESVESEDVLSQSTNSSLQLDTSGAAPAPTINRS